MKYEKIVKYFKTIDKMGEIYREWKVHNDSTEI